MFSMNPRDLKRMMKRMGIDVQELSGVKSVTITAEGKEIILRNPQVTVMKVQGTKIYQVVATLPEEVVEESSEEVREVSFSEEDISFVMEQAGVSREKAVEALEKAGGDIAQAILLLTGQS
ncbi:MAG: nascent polypeptide-associated complex protein [Desulfurococcales archaeon]|nr:nascent polypeptide-associated complex protein [Desulfurococcales archaeon]